MRNYKFIFKIVVMLAIIAFAIYEITIMSINLVKNDFADNSKIGCIVGLVLFSIVIGLGIGTLIVMIKNEKHKKYYILKK